VTIFTTGRDRLYRRDRHSTAAYRGQDGASNLSGVPPEEGRRSQASKCHFAANMNNDYWLETEAGRVLAKARRLVVTHGATPSKKRLFLESGRREQKAGGNRRRCTTIDHDFCRWPH
jgi:hypothetical protein